ncbi:response regulator [[Eubacterium] hominis]|uniref:response regulator n=1 Tax=[Eubacterium] hominis TaxID=2764325 RepID=UPI003A4E06F1
MLAKILIVDDAMFMRTKLKDTLESAIPCECLEAKNGQIGCELFETMHPDLVLLDISMPVMDGIRALDIMRKHDKTIPIIMCSAAGQQSQIMKAIALGAKDFIVKPFQNEQIINAVKRYLK